MQRISKCIVCGLPDDFSFGDVCKCTPRDKERHYDALEEEFSHQNLGVGEPTITECKRVLQANGYIVKKKPKRKKRARR